MDLINNLQAEIMEQLGRFAFLSVSQVRMLTGKSLGYLREQLASLSRKGYIKSYHVEITHTVRAENIYYLTMKGSEFLQIHAKAFADDIKLPVGVPLVVRDYHHRKNFIDLQIALYRYLQEQKIFIEMFATYFDKTGNVRKDKNLTAKTAIPLDLQSVFIPDGVLKTDNSLYLLEMYCDKDTKRIITQLGTHARAISIGSPSRAFNMPDRNPTILSVFEHKGIKDAVIKRLLNNDNFKPMTGLFFFATLEDIKKDCSSAWHTITMETLVIK